MYTNDKFEDLLGKTLIKIDVSDDVVTFYTLSGEIYQLYHIQDCCESVAVESVDGNLSDLLDTPLIQAEESESGENPEDYVDGSMWGQDSFTWTFYKLATKNGYVTIRWYGESNGYYSESVDFCKIGDRG